MISIPLALVWPTLVDAQQYLVSGLAQGCIYALIALAFVTIANVTGVYNFAQGQWVVLGGFVAIACHEAGMSTIFVLILPMLAVAGFALIQERVTVAPIRAKAGALQLVMASLGAGVLLEGLMLAIWGDEQKSLPPFNEGDLKIFDAATSYQTLWIWGATAVSLVAMVWLFRRTTVGRAMRACAINPIAARLVGIRLGYMSMLAFVIGGALSGLIGAVSVPLTGVFWSGGFTLGLVGFIAAALARFEDPVGAVVAGIGLGLVGAFAAGMVSAAYSDAILYGVLIAYLLVRAAAGPEGAVRRLFHRRASVKSRAELLRSRVATRAADLTKSATVKKGRRLKPPTLSSLGRMLIPCVVFLVLAALVPTLFGGEAGVMDVAIFIVLAAIGATGLVLVLGLSGQFSLGQGAYYLLSGYAFALLTTKAGFSIIPAMLVSIALAAFAGAVLGWLTIQLRGFDLAIATLAFHLILLVVVVQADWLGGSLGLPGVPFHPFGIDLTSQTNFYWVTIGFLAVCLVIAGNLWHSDLGRGLRAIASDQEGAESVGLKTQRLKLGVLAVGAGMGGAAGFLWVSYLAYATPTSWDFSLMIALLAYVIVGGVTNVYGGVIGAAIVGILQYVATGSVSTGIGTGASSTQVIINGGLIIVVILLVPGGLVSLPDLARSWYRKRQASAVEPQTEATAPPIGSAR
jgi:branched-subunit amino acid ABC-type transport system permease component